jgi:hypothetical protein
LDKQLDFAHLPAHKIRLRNTLAGEVAWYWRASNTVWAVWGQVVIAAEMCKGAAGTY